MQICNMLNVNECKGFSHRMNRIQRKVFNDPNLLPDAEIRIYIFYLCADLP